MRSDMNEGHGLRDIVIRVARQPHAKDQAALREAIVSATVFLEVTGMPAGLAHGQRHDVGAGSNVRMPTARLPNGMEMVKVSACPPCVAGDGGPET